MDKSVERRRVVPRPHIWPKGILKWDIESHITLDMWLSNNYFPILSSQWLISLRIGFC